MKKTFNAIIMAAFVLAASSLFCLAVTEMPKLNIMSVDEQTTEFYTLSFCLETTEKTDLITLKGTSKKPKTTKESTTTPKPTTTKKPVTTTKPATTAIVTKYNIQEMEDRLVNGNWHFYDNNREYECKFFRDGSYETYDENGSVCERGYFCIDGNYIFIFNLCGEVTSKMIYDSDSGEFFAENYEKESTTASRTDLNDSNAVYLLSDAVLCYDDFLNSTTFGLEYDCFGEYITCPHCGDQAFLVNNFSSLLDIYKYIDQYLTGDAKMFAEQYVEECTDLGMITEQNGKLYVCGMYNEKGYCVFDCNTIRVISEYRDGMYRVAVDDVDGENTCYLNVYTIEGKYKIG